MMLMMIMMIMIKMMINCYDNIIIMMKMLIKMKILMMILMMRMVIMRKERAMLVKPTNAFVSVAMRWVGVVFVKNKYALLALFRVKDVTQHMKR